ncbi:MAG TPA: hypothetical protein VHF86_08465 [Xanthomonadaceae bacterium]|nr:hypothetical protein [Xanthomonadaceae bacterium]
MSRDESMPAGAVPDKAGGGYLDDFQREVLAELGLQPYLLAGAVRAPAAIARVAGPTGPIPPALLEALARAAGCDLATIAALPGVEAACTGAAGKRALWPRLRRLRAGRR